MENHRKLSMIRHTLYEIDLEQQIAFCTACGWTEIYIPKNRTKQTPKVMCITRFQEIKEAHNNYPSVKRRLKQGAKLRHLLSEIDRESLTAICSVCGLTKIVKRSYRKVTYYSCATGERVTRRKYRRSHYSSKLSSSLAHILSQIDEENKTAICSRCGPVTIYILQGKRKIGRRCSNAPVKGVPPAQQIRRMINIQMINEYKVEHGCKQCGFKTSPLELSLRSRNPKEKYPNVEKLLKLNREQLMQQLEKCEPLCTKCHNLT